jgi:FtsZ-binding cell division protein ZapB
MQNSDELIQHLTTENRWLKERLDVALNTIVLLQEEVQHLKDEIATLKGQKPRPKIPPSALEGAKSKDKQNDKNKLSRGRHPRRKKTAHLEIHARNRIKPESIPVGAVFKGCQKFTVQDIILRPYNTVYELERWQLPDSTYVTGKLPENIRGHYGPQLVCYILHQYYGCRITEPLLFAQLKEIGILISEGQLSNILIQAKDVFHQEKSELLSAGIAATGQVKVDDTGARHRGRNGYSTIIGNEYFTYIVSTNSKSRINFLQVLHGSEPRYLINEDTADYVESIKPSHWLRGYLLSHATNRSMSQTEWEAFLLEINLKSDGDVKLATEAALFADLIANGIPKDLGVHGDDAGQFNVFVRSLCWIHEERHYRKLIPADEATRQTIEQVREEIWDLYKGLQEYRLAPSDTLKAKLDALFDDLFLKKKTTSPTLNHQLAKTYAKKAELLRVLERPATPLHNNGTETDAREMVVKRKISGGTRSEEGQKCRDTFISLKKTCVKLEICFLRFLEDRICRLGEIPRLSQIILTRSANQSMKSQTCP